MTLLEKIDERLALCAKATPGPWEMHVSLARVELFMGIHTFRSPTFDYTRSLERAEKDGTFCVQSRSQREGELAALKCAVEALEKPYICSVCGDRSKEKCGRVCDGDESSCCKYFLNFDQALAQITKLLSEGE